MRLSERLVEGGIWELVSDPHAWCSASPLQQFPWQALGTLAYRTPLDQRIQCHFGLVCRTPEPMLHPGELYRRLIELPRVSGAGRCGAGERIPAVYRHGAAH